MIRSPVDEWDGGVHLQEVLGAGRCGKLAVRPLLGLALALAACGRVDSGPDDSPNGTGGGDSAGGSGSSPSAAGGADGTATTGGGGGLAGQLPKPLSPCYRDYVGLEPPCGESDVYGLWPSCGLWFDVPVAHVTPPALDLQVVLLPLGASAGASGLGGMGGLPTEPLALEVILLVPSYHPWEADETFDLLEPTGYVRAGYWTDGDLPAGYVVEPTSTQGQEDTSYGVAEVAVIQGTETLSVHRGLFGGDGAPGDICVK